MAESTLSKTYTDLMRAVAYYLGYGFKANQSEGLTSDQESICSKFVNDGYLFALYPLGGYRWSFLKPTTSIVIWPSIAKSSTVTVTGVYEEPTTTLTASSATFYPSMAGKTISIDGVGNFTIAGYTSPTVVTISADATCSDAQFSIDADGDYRLPDNFAGLEGELTYQTAGRVPHVSVVSERMIRKYRVTAARTGQPYYAAVRPLESDGASGQRFELNLYPTPNQVYILLYRTNAIPDKLTADNPYPLGGAVMGPVYEAAALAAAESGNNDGESEKKALYTQLLASAIERDKMTICPGTLGYNGDASDGVSGSYVIDRVDGVTYNGVLYDGVP